MSGGPNFQAGLTDWPTQGAPLCDVLWKGQNASEPIHLQIGPYLKMLNRLWPNNDKHIKTIQKLFVSNCFAFPYQPSGPKETYGRLR